MKYLKQFTTVLAFSFIGEVLHKIIPAAVGTAKALEMGEIEGALSSLSIVVAGILTVFGAPLFAKLLPF